MEFLKALLNPSWVGSIIGVIGLAIAFLLYRASRIGPRPVYQVKALRLVGKAEQALPEDVDILFRGKNVPRLTMTQIIFWNSGKAMLDGKNIILDDPLRLEFSQDAEVLRVRVLRVTRETNKFKAKINSDSPNQVICSFDYLEVGDGAVVELLHTDKERYPKVQGTIRGVPKGILDWGRSLSLVRFEHRREYKLLMMFLIVLLGFGVYVITAPLLLPMILKDLNYDNIADITPGARWSFLILGLLSISLPSIMLWKLYRRRFPESLMDEDIGE